MIIDIHMHPFCKEATWGDLNKVIHVMAGDDPSVQKRMGMLIKNLASKTSIQDYITLMDKVNIDKAVIVSFNINTAYGVCIVTNDDIANFVLKFPERFIGFGCIDVLADDDMDQLEYAIESLELKGIKLAPPVQKFDISETQYDPIWRKMIDLDIPLWTHTGNQVTTPGSIAKYGHPMLIDDLALRHKDLIIIMGHLGTPWFWDTWSVVLRHRNVYMDISAHPDLYPYFPWDAFSQYLIEDKVLFGSDYPLCHWNKILPAIENLPISNNFKKKILGKNASMLLGL